MRRSIQTFILVLATCLLVSGCGASDPAALDRKALESLREAGSDLSKPHPFDFYLYHPEQVAAKALCTQLEREGFQTQVREGAGGDDWLCLASTDFVPTFEALTKVQDRMYALAGQFGAEYDGWETMVIP